MSALRFLLEGCSENVSCTLCKTRGHAIVCFDAERVEDGPAVRPYRPKRVTATSCDAHMDRVAAESALTIDVFYP